jgi:hypothetical protein
MEGKDAMQQFAEIISRAKHNPLTKDTARFHTARGRGRRLIKNAQGALHRSWDVGEKIHVSRRPMAGHEIAVTPLSAAPSQEHSGPLGSSAPGSFDPLADAQLPKSLLLNDMHC